MGCMCMHFSRGSVNCARVRHNQPHSCHPWRRVWQTPAVHSDSSCGVCHRLLQCTCMIHECLLIIKCFLHHYNILPSLSSIKFVMSFYKAHSVLTCITTIYTPPLSYKLNFIMRSQHVNNAHSVIAANLILLTQFLHCVDFQESSSIYYSFLELSSRLLHAFVSRGVQRSVNIDTTLYLHFSYSLAIMITLMHAIDTYNTCRMIPIYYCIVMHYNNRSTHV